jgi:isoleucyl-tRNA synthetase
MSKRFYEQAVKETLGKFILTFWNSYNFFATYAALDNFNPQKDILPIQKRQFLDKWIISRFNKISSEVKRYMKTFEVHKAARVVEGFIIEDFSNWYLRRSRKRLWAEEKTHDKLAGYSTMYEVLLGLSKLVAPFIPFITEEVYQNLKTNDMPKSVHLCDYIISDKKMIDSNLEKGMEKIRALVEVGRALRSKIGIKVRIPLKSATLVCDKKIEELIRDLLELLNEEINVKKITFERDTLKFMTKTVRPDRSKIGPNYKDKARQIIQKIEEMDKIKLYRELELKNEIILNIQNEKIKLTKQDFEIVETVKENLAKVETEDAALILDTKITPELEAEGLAREIVRRIQSMRKELDLYVEDKIFTEIKVDTGKINSLKKWQAYIKGETRSNKISYVNKPSGKLVKKWDIDELQIEIGIKK